MESEKIIEITVLDKLSKHIMDETPFYPFHDEDTISIYNEPDDEMPLCIGMIMEDKHVMFNFRLGLDPSLVIDISQDLECFTDTSVFFGDNFFGDPSNSIFEIGAAAEEVYQKYLEDTIIKRVTIRSVNKIINSKDITH